MTGSVALLVGLTVGFAPGQTVRHAALQPARAAVSDSQEIALGGALAAQFDIDRGIQPTPETSRIEAYLQSIADSLGKHARRRLPWRIHFDPHPASRAASRFRAGTS